MRNLFILVPMIIRVLGSRLFGACVVVVAACYIAIWVDDERPNTGKELARVLFNNAEPIAIASVAAILLLEMPARKKVEQYEAWQVVNSAMGQVGSGGRTQALEALNRDRVCLNGLAVPEAYLVGIKLKFAQLQSANFSKTGLTAADLAYANLSLADLNQAELSRANLSGADLLGADLSGADLSEADLSGANLSGADLSGANLSGANLSGVCLLATNLSDTIWDDKTQWPILSEAALARNFPEALKKSLEIKDSALHN